MDHAQCRRCLKHNRPGSDYCATCGCRLHLLHRTPEAPPVVRPPAIVPWILLVTLIAATTLPPQKPQPRGLIYAGASQPAIGLVVDFPPDYPAGHFTRCPSGDD